MNRFHAGPRTKRQRGFSFFEVLVAALILGIGVLGFAGLQMRAIGSTGVAHFRAQAAVLAAEMAERIRIVEAGARSLPDTDPRRNNDSRLYITQNWDPTATLPTSPPATWTPGAQTCMYNVVTAAACTETALITADAREMQFMADQLLPGGAMAVQRCNGVGNLMCVYVGWSGQDPRACTVGGNNPNCFGIEVML